MIAEYITYEKNLVLSAIAPEAMVADVPQNTIWKMTNAAEG